MRHPLDQYGTVALFFHTITNVWFLVVYGLALFISIGIAINAAHKSYTASADRREKGLTDETDAQIKHGTFNEYALIAFVVTYAIVNCWLASYTSRTLFYGFDVLLYSALLYVPVWFVGKKAMFSVKVMPTPPTSGSNKHISAQNFGTLAKIFPSFSCAERGKPLIYIDRNSQNLEADPWNDNTDNLRVSNEDRGLVLGVPGSGKTTFLIAQLIDWMQSGKSLVATDIKPEIWAILKHNGIFEKYGYTDWVFNPTNTNSHKYNMFGEISGNAELNEVLAVIIPNGQGETSAFSDNARRLLKAVLLELGDNASLPAARRFINDTDDVSELLSKLRKSELETVQDIAKDIKRTAENERLLGSIMTTLIGAFEFLDDDRIKTQLSASDFKLKEVLKQPKQAVFLQFEQEYKSTTATLFGAMVAHTLRILQMNYRERDSVFVALDEIINCAPIPKFTETLNTMRSANMPTFLYLQSLEGLNRLYGLNASDLFMSAANFKAVFRLNDNASAMYFSQSIGKTEVTRWASTSGSSTNVSPTSSAFGTNTSTGSSNSRTTSTSIEDIIEAAEFLKLRQNKAVVLYNGEFATLEMPCYWVDYPLASQRPDFSAP